MTALQRAVGSLGFALLLSSLAGCASSPPEIMSWAEYSEGSPHEWPIVLDIAAGDGRLLYFGSRHIYEPGDPQNDHIEELWKDFRPTFAFNEGGHPPVEPTREEAIRKHGEAGLVRFLAARDNVPVTTLDPSRTQEVAWLTRAYTPEQVKLFFVLRAAAQFVARNDPEGLPAEVERVLGIYGKRPGLMQSPTSYAEVEAAFERHFPAHGPVTEIPMDWFDPARDGTFLNSISRSSSEYRDRFIVDVLVRHAAEGHRVFAVVGGSHVVVQERRLRWALGALRR